MDSRCGGEGAGLKVDLRCGMLLVSFFSCQCVGLNFTST
jgi:hypothetical protein